MIKHSRKLRVCTLLLLFLVSATALVSVFPVSAPQFPSWKGYCCGEVPYTWTSRVSTSPIAVGDDVGRWYTLPWSFTFYGESKSRVYICSNGFLIFDPTSPTNDYTNSAEELIARCKIAAFWDDLRTDIAGGIVSTPGVYVDSYSDKLVITWEATRYGDSSDSIKFQIVLFQNGNIRLSLDGSTNFADFTPTIGLSKRDGVGYYVVRDERFATSRTWLFTYDCGCFMWERPGTVGHWPFQYVRRGACLMVPGGYVDHEDPDNYGECGCGPPNSRNYAPDYWYPYWGSNYFLSDIKWYANQYSQAQSITGHSYCYVTEFRIATAYGDYDHFYTTLPNAEFYIGEAETWGGVTTKAGEIYTRTPEQIAAGTIYWADAYFTMTAGVPKDSTAYEYEMKIDDWPYYWIHPGGYPLDWWKVYWAPLYAIKRPQDCEEPFDWLSITEFPGGATVVENVSDNIIIRTMSAIESKDDLRKFIDSRFNALELLIEKDRGKDYIPVTITFLTPLTPLHYITLCKLYGVKPLCYRFASKLGSGISFVKDSEEPFRWDFAKELWRARKDIIIGVTAVYGLLKVKSIDKLKHDPTILLIDPKEDLILQEHINYFSECGNAVVVHFSDDIWVEYTLYG